MGEYAGGRAPAPTPRSRTRWFPRDSLHATPLPISSASRHDLLISSIHEFCGRHLGLLHSGFSHRNSPVPGSACGQRARCPYRQSCCWQTVHVIGVEWVSSKNRRLDTKVIPAISRDPTYTPITKGNDAPLEVATQFPCSKATEDRIVKEKSGRMCEKENWRKFNGKNEKEIKCGNMRKR